MRLEWYVAAIVIASLLTGGPAHGQSPSALLEKGIYSEQTVGNLDEAIRIYKQIIDQEKADRPYVAQAYYHLGECYLKKGQTKEATAAFETLVKRFPGQKEWVAKAEKKIAEARGNLSEAQIAKIVEEAVTTISTCAEGNPKVAKAMESLQGLNENAVVKALTEYLDSKEPTIRRSAIYILQEGEFESIEPAVPSLMKLCSHTEEFTRGMAALALGAKKVDASYPTLCEMALNDKSGYARRCAAIALGWLGRPEAKEVLERVEKDSDPLVRANAEAALKLLSKAEGSETSAPRVVRTTPAAFDKDVDPALDKITVTFDQKMEDKSWSWTGGGETYPKITGEISYDADHTTCTLPVKLEPGKVYWIGVNSPSHKNFRSTDGAPAPWYVILFATKSADGKPTPIPTDLAAKAKSINAAATEAGPAGPHVIRTVPKAFEDDVSPALGKLAVTFDRTMMDGSWSWTGGGETFPKLTGKPSYDAGRRTCSVPVKLEPGKVYWVGINAPSFKNFQTPAHVPAIPYVILFATKSADGKPTPIPEDMARKAREINAATEALGSKTPTAADKRAAEKLAAQAWSLWRQQKFAEAEPLFQKALEKDPTNANTWNGLGWSQFNQGESLNAQHSFEKCLSLEPKHAAALNGMGWIAKNAGRTDEAIGYWEKAVRAAPTATAALNGLATTYMEEKQYDKAVKYYEMWLKVEPNNADAKNGLEKAKVAMKESR